jgi:hypothetical protein
MEILQPESMSGPLPNYHVFVEGIGEFNHICVNSDSLFPYLDIKLSWNNENNLLFSIYKKSGKLVKYLNMYSHHHWHHKVAVLAGVELRLALLTTLTSSNTKISISDIYPDKHDALQIAGQIRLGQKMRTLKAVLDKEPQSSITRRKKKSCRIDKQDSLFIINYANFGNHRPISQVIKCLRNSYNFK